MALNTNHIFVIVCVAMGLFAADPAKATPVGDKYAQLGGAKGFLGVPATAETPTPDGVGRYRHFAGGSIYWHPSTGAREVHGLIRDRWAALGYERSYLGYPTTDEIDSVDGGGRVSRFQGGELIWRQATNKVSEVKSTDLVIDLPFPPDQPWYVIQSNGVANSDSHLGQWAYCWDFMVAGPPQSASNGKLFVAAADGPIIYVDEGNESKGLSGLANVIIQRWGPGRYGSYLHIRKESYGRHFGGAHPLPQSLPWSARPIARSGATLAEVGDVGAPVGAFHLHFCVTTKPDRPQFAPFESVPVAFRNYSVSTNNGKSWSFVPVGVPKREQWIRREARPGPSAAQVNGAASVLNAGIVKGQVSPPTQGVDPAGGHLTVRIDSNWGEPLAAKTIEVPAGSRGPWPYDFPDVAAFGRLKVVATFQRASQPSTAPLSGESNPFDLRPAASATANVVLKSR